MISELSSLEGWALIGWDLDLTFNVRLELFRIDFGTPLDRIYARCEVLFHSPSSLNVVLTPRQGSVLLVERVQSRKNTDGRETHNLSFGDFGNIELTSREHVVILY
jgi:hypothetical protein